MRDNKGSIKSIAILIIVILLVGSAGFIYYKIYEKERKIEELKIKVTNMKIALKNISDDYPIANIVVLEQFVEDSEIFTKFLIEFVNENGIRTIPPKEYQIKGDMIYFEGVMMIFKKDWVEVGKEKSLVFPTRIYSNKVPPVEGIMLNILDESGVPVVYRVDSNSELNLSKYHITLKDFWLYANDVKQAKEFGIEVLQGQAVFSKYDVKRYYTVFVQNYGGMIIKPQPIMLP